ncbi:MAG: hypothetical protein H0T46_16090 [Deltaproteobacteria bacterium]|nr:hypothetical protein [Deltaproteobacteria bacterium]
MQDTSGARERYDLAKSLAAEPSEASARRLIDMLSDDGSFELEDGVFLFDVPNTVLTVKSAACESLTKMADAMWHVLVEALSGAMQETRDALVSALGRMAADPRSRMPEAAHDAIVEAAQASTQARHCLEAAVWERDFARRVRDNELTEPSAFWRARLVHPNWSAREAARQALADLEKRKQKASDVEPPGATAETRNREEQIRLRDACALSTPELLARIYADPLDRYARVAFEQQLENRGDPRARAIQLMARTNEGKTLGCKERTELAALIERHWREWVGPAAKLVVPRSKPTFSPVFADGFLSEAKLRIESEADLELARDPVFATLKWLICDKADVVLRSTMKLLRTLSGSLRSFAGVCELPYELEATLAFVNASDWAPELDARIGASRAPVFRNLRTLHAKLPSAKALGWIVESWIPTRVESIYVDGTPVPLQPLMRVFRANHQLKLIRSSVDGAPGMTCARRYNERDPVLEVSLDYSDQEQAFAALDAIDGSNWILHIEYPIRSQDGGEKDRRQTLAQQRFSSFARVDVSDPIEYEDDHGM